MTIAAGGSLRECQLKRSEMNSTEARNSLKAAAPGHVLGAGDGLDPCDALRCLAQCEKMSDILFPTSNDPNFHKVRFFRDRVSVRERSRADDAIGSLIEKRKLRGSQEELRRALYCSFQMHQYWLISWRKFAGEGLGRTGAKAESMLRNVDVILELINQVPLRGPTEEAPLAFSHSPEAVAYAMCRFIAILPRSMSMQHCPGDDLDVACVVRSSKSLANKIKALVASLEDKNFKNRIYLARAIVTNEPFGLVQKVDKDEWKNQCLNKNFIRSMLEKFRRILVAATKIDGSKFNLRAFAYRESVSAPLAHYWRWQRGKLHVNAHPDCPFVNFLLECFSIINIPVTRDALANLDIEVMDNIIQTGLPQYWTPGAG
jgi:hypothetical protein